MSIPASSLPSASRARAAGADARMTINDALVAQQAGHESSQSLLARAQATAQRVASLNPIAFVDWDAARAAARLLDDERAQRLAAGAPMPPLLGVPLTIKDLFAVAGMPHHAGTRAKLPPFAGEESTFVTRLRKAGALVFAKTNMHEIALGATGENVWTGDVCNPWNPQHQAGGSSSGAGVCAATGIGLGGVGSDTGGSVRIPAAFCGVTGFKPSFGAIPLDNALYLSWTCDHAGPLAPTVDDCVRLYEVMAARSMAHGATPRHPRLGVPSAWLTGRLAPAVREHFDRLRAQLRTAGVEFVDCPLPRLPEATACYSSIVRAEAATVHHDVLIAGGEGFSDGVLGPMRAGQKITAVEYLQAMATRAAIGDDLDRTLRDVDALILPTTAILPPPRGTTEAIVEGGTTSVREAVLGQTLPFSMCGVPALTIPCGFVSGLPMGVSLVGGRDADAALLALGRWLEALLPVLKV